MATIDLHMHSVISIDGELEPEEVIRRAASRGIRAAALTDHNSVRGVSRAWAVSYTPLNYEQGEKVVDAIIAGGINFIELTMTMDDGDPVGFIKLMAEKYKNNDKVVIGAGTVLDPETARACILAGANYIVSTA